jgi:ribosome-binding factor A
MLTLHGNEVEKNKDTIDILNSASGNSSSELSESYSLERFPGARFIRGEFHPIPYSDDVVY